MVGTVLHMSTEKQKGVTTDSCRLLKAGVSGSCYTTYDEFKIRNECLFDICRLRLANCSSCQHLKAGVIGSRYTTYVKFKICSKRFAL